ncbi:uncharacterized protein LOC144905990 [Branchiostoma floridae x Branchiostoma belcheri]
MGRKLRHLLIFLLIILKEPNMPEAACSCAPSAPCKCVEMGLSSIPPDLPTSISSLDLTKNYITAVNQSLLLRYGDLTELHLTRNQITMIQPGTFANLSQLLRLRLTSNQITMIQAGAFQNLPRLNLLYLDSNRIEMIQSGIFENLPQLEKLSLSSNQIAKIPSGIFANLPQLERLHLSNNLIRNIPSGIFANLSQLQYLYLSNNQITMIPNGTFANLSKLQYLYLSDNQISKVPEGTFGNPSLITLNLASNQITNIHSGTFANVPRLQSLTLQKNKISVILPSAFGLLTSLRDVNLARNPWRCDCRMASFRRNISNFPSIKRSIICDQPAKFKSKELREINPEEMICEEPAVSSVGNASQSAHPVGSTSPTQPPVNPLEIANKCYNATVITSRYHWFFTRNADFTPQNTSSNITATLTSTLTVITSDKPESATSFNLSVLIGSICGSGAGLFVLIGTILGAFWYKRRTRHPPLGLNPSNSNTNTAVPFRNPSRGQLLAALQSNPIYSDVKAPQENPISTEMAIGHDQTGQGQSQTITNTTADVMTSGDEHHYEDIDNYHDQTGQGQSQAITESNTNSTATAMTSGHDQTGWGQSQAITESNTNTTTTAMTSGHDQIGQGQSQANIQSLTVSTHDLAAFMHVGVETLPKELASCHEQAGQGQSQAITELFDTRNLAYGTGQTASKGNSLYQ